MKYRIYNIVLAIAFQFGVCCLSAQTPSSPGFKPPVTPSPGKISNVPSIPSAAGKVVAGPERLRSQEVWVEVYELPNFKGRMVRFTRTVSGYPLSLPFRPDRISVRRSPNPSLAIRILEHESSTVIEVSADQPSIQIGPSGIAGIELTLRPFVEFFELSDFRGRSVVITDEIMNRPGLGLPFSLSGGSAMTGGEGTMAKLAYQCGSSTRYLILTGKLRRINQAGICGVQLDRQSDLRMRMNGILTVIHNNDCRRLYGLVRVRVVEKDAGGNLVTVARNRYGRADENGWVSVFSRLSSAPGIPSQVFDLNQYRVLERDLGTSGRLPPSLNGPPTASDMAESFLVSRSAYFNRRLFLQVQARLGSHHKSCDLCTDYTANATMTEGFSQEFPIGDGAPSHPFVQSGPYRTSGAFTGPVHATYVDFSYSLLELQHSNR